MGLAAASGMCLGCPSAGVFLSLSPPPSPLLSFREEVEGGTPLGANLVAIVLKDGFNEGLMNAMGFAVEQSCWDHTPR